MSDDATKDASTEEQEGTAAPLEGEQQDTSPGGEQKTYTEDYVKELRAENAKHRMKAKEYESKLADIEDAEKSESQKLQEELESTRNRLADYERREEQANWARTVSEETGVEASVIRGSSIEEMREHAELLKSFITPKSGAAYVPHSGTGGERIQTGTYESGRERARGSAA